MEDPQAFLYLIGGIVCLLLYRVLKKRWNIRNNDKKNLFKLLFKNIDNKK